MGITKASHHRPRPPATPLAVVRIAGMLLASALTVASCAPSHPGGVGVSSGWAGQDGSIVGALRLPCGPAPSGKNEALAMMLIGEKTTDLAEAPVPPSASTSPLGPRSAGKSFDYGQVKLYPPVGAKPLVCVDDALRVADSAPVEPSAVKEIWLGQLDASFPASDVRGVNMPWFPNVLAWVVVTDATRNKEECACATPSPGSTETAYIDADTGQRLFATGDDVVLGPAH